MNPDRWLRRVSGLLVPRMEAVRAPWRFLPCAACCEEPRYCGECALLFEAPDEVLVELPAMADDTCTDCEDYGDYSYYLPGGGCLYEDTFTDDICCTIEDPTPDYKKFEISSSNGNCKLTLWHVICWNEGGDQWPGFYWERHVWELITAGPITAFDHDLPYDAAQKTRNHAYGWQCDGTGTTAHVSAA